ncbi:11S globulin seed storage protein Jug r 4-like isoform X1 [Quercus robur]|uniref:11S globulin seed storage protein Jug r 4-like isoform X1 n=1 Tax=Quercus robur TaxID=38942 RepID=UPI0021626CE5|nr:11S globulin seed storage protein Jug r 4-like isoform X1 [Quercus robur]
MAKPILLYTSLCLLLVLFNGCLATQTSRQQQRFNQCQLDRLDALEPNHRIEAEAGVIESWDPNDKQFQCVGVAVVRRTIEPNGLLLPQYANTAQLIYIERGYGIFGAVLPGCPNTYQESQQQQQQREGQQRDQHQKIRNFRQGDIIALPAGVAHWLYNDGDSEVVALSLLDTNNQANQLDQNPRHFYLAGNPEDEFQLQGRSPRGQRRHQQQQGQGRRERGHQQQQGQGNNLFSGFRTEDLADAFNVDKETIRNLQGFHEDRKNIVKVKGRLQVARPPRSREERERLERQEREQEREDEREQRESHRGGRDNGIEETLCTLRLRENIHDPSRADIYNPQAGRISTLNSHNLPVLRWLQLSAEFGRLQRDAIYVPHWNRNAHSVIYVVKGRAQVQVVDDFGQTVFHDELQQHQILTVPQNFAVVKRASSSEGFEWVAFKTNDNAQISPLAGQTSILRAIPADVLANAFQLSREDVSELKSNLEQQEITMVKPSRSSSQRRAIALMKNLM